VLKFTYEIEKANTLPFLDVLAQNNGNTLSTSVFVKDTNYGDCLNFDSLCPDRYKIGVIKALLHRGYHICSDWNLFHIEINRIKQLLVNNNFPMSLIEKTVNNFIRQKMQEIPMEDANRTEIKLFYQNQMSAHYKLEEKQLQSIIKKHVTPAQENSELKLLIYYKNPKLRDILMRNRPKSLNPATSDRHHVVYEYTCARDGCNATPKYIGYTTSTVWERFGMHTQTGSIKKHLQEVHDIQRIPRRDLIKDVSILKTCSSKRDLIFTEAILIKTENPSLNSQAEGCNRLLKLFKH
jgi:hypothetical protein